MEIKKFWTFFQEHCLFDKDFGLEGSIIKPGHIQYQMQILEKHLSSPRTAHGGVIAAMMDGVLGLASLSVAVLDNKVCSTIEFKINYITPAHLGDILLGVGLVDFQGKTHLLASGTIHNKDNGKLIAKAMGTYNLYPMEKKLAGS